MIYSNTLYTRITVLLITIIALTGMLMATGCDDDNPTEPEDEALEGAEVVIDPQEATFEVNEELNFSAFVISASGDTINDELNVEWNWYSSDTDVFTVQSNGTATGHNPGEAFCIVEASTTNSKIVAKRVPIGLDSARVFLF